MNAILVGGTAATFRLLLEAGSTSVSSHNEVHRYIGGHMGAAASPNDPIFWLHHCNIDRLWAMWQLDGHAGTPWFPSSAAFGHTLASPMWRSTGSVVYDLPSEMPAYYLPDFTDEPARTNGELIDHHALGYAYDTEPVVGVPVDRSGSMTGMTSDPLASMAPVSKWNLARKGVEHFLADCQAAYDARVAYWVGSSSFVITMVPQDAEGHLLAPHHLDGITLRVGGVAINVKRIEGLAGSVRLEGKFHDGLASVTPDGRSFDADTHAHGPCDTGSTWPRGRRCASRSNSAAKCCPSGSPHS